jgi:hypothetical protein
MGRAREVLLVMVLLTGLVFIGQGLGLLRGRSFMVDDVRWAVIGLVLVLGGVAALARPWRRGS